MSAPFSTSSLANSLNLRVSTPAARNAVLGIEGIAASSDSFSRTLQNQMNAGGNASTRSESAPSQATREPERARAPEPNREPERSPERSAADGADKNTRTDRTDQQGAAQDRSGEAHSVEGQHRLPQVADENLEVSVEGRDILCRPPEGRFGKHANLEQAHQTTSLNSFTPVMQGMTGVLQTL